MREGTLWREAIAGVWLVLQGLEQLPGEKARQEGCKEVRMFGWEGSLNYGAKKLRTAGD